MMANGGNVKNAIQWHEGMLLRPQHFQQADRRVEQLFAYHLNVTSSHPWGIVRFVYDGAAIVTGTLRVLALEAILPDGLLISFHQAQGEDLSLKLDPYQEDLKSKPMTVYVTIPEYRAGKANVEGDNPRFRSTEHPSVVDENTGDGMMTLPSLKPNYALTLSETPPAHYVCLPLMRIQKIANAYQVLDFIPPQLKVTADSSLGLMCSDLARRIREKAAFLADRLTSQTSELMSAQAENAVTALCTGLLPLEAMIAAGASHPFDLYVQLNNLAAHLISILPGQMAPSFTPYNHDDVRSSFTEVIRFAEGMLERIQEGYYVVPFTLKDRTFCLNLNSQWMTPRLILGAKASSKMSEKDVADWISQALIATDNHVASCREKRILGAARKIISGVNELKLMPARDVILFAVENTPDFIGSDQVLQVFNVADSQDMRPEEIVLYISKENQDIL